MKQKFWYFSVSNVKNIVFGISDANANHETIAFFPSAQKKKKKKSVYSVYLYYHLRAFLIRIFNFDV